MHEITHEVDDGDKFDLSELDDFFRARAANEPDLFFVEIHTSANYPTVLPGDRLLADRSALLEEGSMCIAVFSDGREAVGRYSRSGDTVALRPDNPAFPEIACKATDAEFVRATKVHRKL